MLRFVISSVFLFLMSTLLYADSLSDFNEGQDAFHMGNYTRALALWKPLAEQGNARAQYNLGTIYENGKGVTQDYKMAVSWYRKAAEQGYANAQYNLGVMYENGQGVTQDYQIAISWYRKAAEQDDAYAQSNLGFMYENGKGVTQDYKAAVLWYTKAAEQGNSDAQSNLGLMYENGKGVTQDYQTAVSWYRKAAEQGNARAQNSLGIMYANGKGVTQDYKAAVLWYTKAAEQGNSDAQNNLGVMYQGVMQDYKAAVLWYTKAAEQGNATAQSNLGFMYNNGQGVAQNHVIAYALFNLSAAADPSQNNNAFSNRTVTVELMNTNEIETGQALTRSMQKNTISKAIALYLKTNPVKKVAVIKPATSTQNNSPYPSRPAKRSGVTSCNTNCNNGDCYRTYDSGKQKHFQVSPTYDLLNSQWKYDAGPC